MTTKIAIIGGGPAGIFCALSLCKMLKSEFKIDIYEKDFPLKTLLPTGGGRCNLSNNILDFRELARNYPRGEKFLYSVFSRFSVSETLDFFKEIGVKTYIQNDNRIFPISESSKDVREKMLSKLKSYKNVRFIKKFVQNKNELKNYNKIIISTGSKGGYNLACQFSHTIIEPKKSLCGYITKEKYPPGVTLKTPQGVILFTHTGVSGPFIYKHSALHAREDFPRIIEVDLIDGLKLKEAIKNNPRKSFGNIVSEFIPKSLSHTLVKNCEAQACQIKNDEIKALEKIRIEALGVDSKGEIVTSGGVSLDEVDNFCKSKLNDKLYFCGEILDIDGFCGGFNLQNCWSSAYSVASSIANSNP